MLCWIQGAFISIIYDHLHLVDIEASTFLSVLDHYCNELRLFRSLCEGVRYSSR